VVVCIGPLACWTVYFRYNLGVDRRSCLRDPLAGTGLVVVRSGLRGFRASGSGLARSRRLGMRLRISCGPAVRHGVRWLCLVGWRSCLRILPADVGLAGSDLCGYRASGSGFARARRFGTGVPLLYGPVVRHDARRLCRVSMWVGSLARLAVY
jgi:hypothetical protein